MSLLKDVRYINNQRELVDKFVFSSLVIRTKSTKAVDHEACHTRTDPDITVDDPDDVSCGFTISTAHVTNLGIWPKVQLATIMTGQVGVVFLNEDLGIKSRIVAEEAQKGGESRVMAI